MKKFNQTEYIVKGFSNKKRIEIIHILKKNPELSVGEIAEKMNSKFSTISNHLLKMMATGIVMKRDSGVEVRHTLTEKGKIISNFLDTI